MSSKIDNYKKNLEIINQRKEVAKLKKAEQEIKKEEIFINKFKDSKEKKDYIRDNYYKNIATLFFLFLSFASSLSYAYYSYFVYEPPAKLLVLDSELRVLEEKPLIDDILSNEQLTQWVNDNVSDLFTYNYISFERHGSKQENTFTGNGYKSFMEAFNGLRLQTKVKKQKAIVEPIMVSPLKIANTGSVAGNTVKAWMFEGVIVLNLHGQNGREAFKYNVNVLVIRTSFKDNKNGIAIEKIQLI